MLRNRTMMRGLLSERKVSAFHAYNPGQESPKGFSLRENLDRGAPPQKQRRHPPPMPTCTYHLSVGLLEVYRKVNPAFVYVGAIQNPRRVLTKDARPGGNHGMDNKASDLILTVGDVLCGPNGGHKFRVLDMLGQGTFGQVVKCRAEWFHPCDDSPPSSAPASLSSTHSTFEELRKINPPTSHMVAVKIVKNKPAYFNQAKVEIKVLKKVSEELGDGANSEEPGSSIIRLLYDFEYHHHLCLVFELMSVNLYELIKHQDFRGLPFNRVRAFCTQLLDALECLCRLGVIHCDLKPENILLENFGDPTTPRIKLIDLGSACYRDHVAFTYIQSRFYRAPEVLLGLKYSSPIDLWSLGCVAIELFMGLPVFPGVSAHNQLSRIVEMVGMPPNWMLEEGKKAETFFVRLSGPPEPLADSHMNDLEFSLKEDYFVANRRESSSSTDEPLNKKSLLRDDSALEKGKWRIKTAQEWAFENGLRDGPEKTKRYVKEKTLSGIIFKCESKRRPKTEPVEVISVKDLECFVDFCSGLLRIDPNMRWTAAQAIHHPFITQVRFDGPYVPYRTPEPILEEDEEDLLFASGDVAAEPNEMELEVEDEEDDEIAKVESTRRTKTKATPLAVSKPIPTPQSLSSSSKSNKFAGLSSSQQRSKRKLSEANSVGSPGTTASSLSSVLGSPITRPDVPNPIAHQARWSDLGLLASPNMRPVGLPFSTHTQTLDGLGSPSSKTPKTTPQHQIFASSLPNQSFMDQISNSEISAFRRIDFQKHINTNTSLTAPSNLTQPATSSFWSFPSLSLSSLTGSSGSTSSGIANNKLSPPSSMVLNHIAQQPQQQSQVSPWTASLFTPSETIPEEDNRKIEVPKPNDANAVENTPSVEKSLAKWAPFDKDQEEKG